jgi:peroxiredoxin
MTIQVGEKLPSFSFKVLTENGMSDLSTDQIFRGKKVLLFGVPGAFSPICSNVHLPGFIEKIEAFKKKGIDCLACIAVNDPFVMHAWAEKNNALGQIDFLPDGNATFIKQLGLEMDASPFGMGTRSKRFTMVVDDYVVKSLYIEEYAGTCAISSAESILETL